MFEARRYRMAALVESRELRVCEYTFGSKRCHCGRNSCARSWKTTAKKQWLKNKLFYHPLRIFR